MKIDLRGTEVIAPNFKRRLSGVTSTIVQLVPLQRQRGVKIAALGPGLPDSIARVSAWSLAGLWNRPAGRHFRVWHARRNPEMLAGVVLKYLMRAPLKLVFTSASQRNHTRYTKWLIRRMDAVVATSAKSAAYLEVPHTVIMHGIKLDRFSPPADRKAAKQAVGLKPDRLHIGCFGRIRKQKGTDLFVDAVIRLLAADSRWEAIITGRTTAEHAGYEKELRERASASGVGERIRFVGEPTDIIPWYQALDLYVAPQRWEGFGLTPLEAMACGVPVVATDVGAFSDLIVEGVTGTVVSEMSAQALAAAIESFAADDDARAKSGSEARSHVEARFALTHEADALNTVYESLLAS